MASNLDQITALESLLALCDTACKQDFPEINSVKADCEAMFFDETADAALKLVHLMDHLLRFLNRNSNSSESSLCIKDFEGTRSDGLLSFASCGLWNQISRQNRQIKRTMDIILKKEKQQQSTTESKASSSEMCNIQKILEGIHMELLTHECGDDLNKLRQNEAMDQGDIENLISILNSHVGQTQTQRDLLLGLSPNDKDLRSVGGQNPGPAEKFF
eukprot:GCRY01002902.1.p1 GENE.GCRY01002902.1~~GCRY01002902.1.p1  ORF type:complete len:216 (+),score=13.50 GCRY01002902.1:135-782(+)